MTQLNKLDSGQSVIYTKTNIRRAFPDFDDTDIAGMYRQEDQLSIVRLDGTRQDFAAQPIANAYKDFTSRLPNFLLISVPITGDRVSGVTIVMSYLRVGITSAKAWLTHSMPLHNANGLTSSRSLMMRTH